MNNGCSTTFPTRIAFFIINKTPLPLNKCCDGFSSLSGSVNYFLGISHFFYFIFWVQKYWIYDKKVLWYLLKVRTLTERRPNKQYRLYMTLNCITKLWSAWNLKPSFGAMHTKELFKRNDNQRKQFCCSFSSGNCFFS